MHEVQKIAKTRLCARWGRSVAKAAIWFAPCTVFTGGAQTSPEWIQHRRPGMEMPAPDPSQLEDGGPESEKRLRALNAERQKALVADTGKLLKLAAELDAEVGQSNPDALTAEQLHKVAEIEKLARSVREKMSLSVRSTPVFRAPFGVPPAE